MALLALGSMGLAAMGSMVGAAGALYSGAAQSSMYKYQAGVAAVNARIAKQNTEYSREIGEFKAQQSGMKTRALVGKTLVAQGASGFRADSGSDEDVVKSEKMLGESEQDVIRSDAARAAYGHEVEALNFESQSNIYNMSAKTSRYASYF